MLRNFLRQLTKATDIAIVIASALVVLAFLTSDYPTSTVETVDKALAAASTAVSYTHLTLPTTPYV